MSAGLSTCMVLRFIASTFLVVGTNIAVSQAQIVYEYAACCALDLSADGLTVYFSTSPEILSRLALVGTASPVAIRQLGTG